MYEWENNNVSTGQIEARISWLRGEIRRITEITLRGVFVKHEDREFWTVRARKLNSELCALEAR